MLPEEKSLVVHKFKCYCQSTYIGQTSCQLKTRIKEHVQNLLHTLVTKTMPSSQKCNKKSTLAECLVNNTYCCINFDISNDIDQLL